MTISERIIEVRKSEGLNQVEFSKKIGLTKQTVSNYETGARQPGLDIILKISEVFNISTDYLLCKSDYKTFEAQSSSNTSFFTKDALNSLVPWDNKEMEFLNILLCSFEFKELVKEFIVYTAGSALTLRKHEDSLDKLRTLIIGKTLLSDKELKEKYLKSYVNIAVDNVLDYLENTVRKNSYINK